VPWRGGWSEVRSQRLAGRDVTRPPLERLNV
jgi:hypothetical protein